MKAFSVRGLFMFAIASTVTVIVGLAIYNRFIATNVPFIRGVVNGGKASG